MAENEFGGEEMIFSEIESSQLEHEKILDYKEQNDILDYEEQNDILDYDHCSCDYLCSALLQSHSFMNFRPSVSNGYFNRDAPTSKLSMVMVR